LSVDSWHAHFAGRLHEPLDADRRLKPRADLRGRTARHPAGSGPDGRAGDQVDPTVLRSLQAAWKTALLGRTMLQVVKDERYEEYPIGRHLDFAYEGILNGMTASQTFTLSPELQERIETAEKVLYRLDDQGNRIGKTDCTRITSTMSRKWSSRKRTTTLGSRLRWGPD
jgi:hypothetical protein